MARLWPGDSRLRSQLAVVVLAILFRLLVGRARWQRLMSTVPLFGALWQSTGVAEWSGLLSVLLRHEIPLPNALRLAGTRHPQRAHWPGVAAAGRRRGTRSIAVPVDVFAIVNFPPRSFRWWSGASTRGR